MATLTCMLPGRSQSPTSRNRTFESKLFLYDSPWVHDWITRHRS